MKKLTAILLSMAFAGAALCACKSDDDTEKEFQAVVYQKESLLADYDSYKFYRNDLLTEGADPSVLYVSDPSCDDFGYYYMYATSDYLGGTGFLCLKSKNLVDWERVGTAFKPPANSWGRTLLWAPCVVFHEGKYYMYYSAHQETRDREAIGLAVANHPAGPFEQWTGTNANGDVIDVDDPFVETDKFSDAPGAAEDQKIKGKTLIDANLFIDDDGKMYLYANCYGIWGMEMKDFYTPVYESMTQLTRIDRSKASAEGSKQLSDESGCNEGAFMTKHNGKYYLTMSVNWFSGKNYSVKQAIGDSPLDPDFEKVDWQKGGNLLTAMERGTPGADYDFMSGTGHHCFIEAGEELFIVYHAHKNREQGGGSRYIAVDKVSYTVNQDGQEIMYVNGPSYSLQPLPSAISGYKNIANEAQITIEGNCQGKEYLTDGIYKNHDYDFIREFEANGNLTITMDFAEGKVLSGISLINSYDFSKWLSVIDEIRIVSTASWKEKEYVLTDILYDAESYYDQDKKIARPGGAFVIDIEEIPVSKITITINTAKTFAISDLIILGR